MICTYWRVHPLVIPQSCGIIPRIMNNTNTYELAFLALSDLSEQDVEALQSTFADTVSAAGGQVVSTGDVHFIRLAYEMTKKVGSKNIRHNDAYFSWMKLSVESSAVNGINEAVRSNNSILRHMIITTESDDSLTNVFSLEQEDEETEVDGTVPVETEKPSEEAEPATEETPVATEQPDDLTKIEGIGPVIATTLVNGGINTYAKLADASVEDIQSMIEGVRGSHDAGTWPEQSALAAVGDWDALQTLQDSLNGGK